MAEIKNNFLGAKLNKDLDKRLVPKNENIDAQKVSIQEAVSNYAGSATPLLGSILNYSESLGFNENTEVIGYYVDEQKKRVYWFVTDGEQYSKGGTITKPDTPVISLPVS